MKPYSLLWFLLPVLVIIGCKKEDAASSHPSDSSPSSQKPAEPGFVENTTVMYWNEKINTVLSAPMNSPTRSRLYAMMQIAIHDALNSIKPKYETYALLNHREKDASPTAAVAAAGYWVIKGLNRQGTFPVDDWYAHSLEAVPDGPAEELGKALGKQAAEAIIARRANDGFNQVILASVNPANGTTPGAYRQTNMNNLRFVANWGTVVQPFVVSSNSQFRPEGPHSLSSAAYAADYQEVQAKGARVNSTRTAAEQETARFWSENRPSLIWNNFARAVIETKKLDAWRTARLLAILHTAIADGLSTVLEANYHFYTWRPETAIREGAADGNDQTTPDPSWVPNLIEAPNANPFLQFVSPPLPEYPSGFTMFGGAAEKVLQWFFNTDATSVQLTSAFLPGVVKTYNSISQAAEDNTVGKIHAGWQFRKGAEDGTQVGRDVAQYVINNHFRETSE